MADDKEQEKAQGSEDNSTTTLQLKTNENSPDGTTAGQGVKRKGDTEEKLDKKPRLDNEAKEASLSKKECSYKAKGYLSQQTWNRLQELSHEELMNVDLLIENVLYEKFYNRHLTEDGLKKHGCPLPDGKNDGTIKPGLHPHGTTVGLCKRCKTPFDVKYEGKVDSCKFHTMASKKGRNGRQWPHNCCGRVYGKPGCRSAPQHVHESNRFNDLTGFRQTVPRDKNAIENRQVYCLDTESIHTKKGLEVCRVTVLDTDIKVVYETMCLPTTDIIDYNTIWSGLTKADLDGVTKTFTDVQDDLLELFSDKTVLVGHCISSDLLALKLIHKTVVETQELYPHDRGFPFRRGLKELASNVLHREIQSGDGHDSKEDAEVTMKLALRAVGSTF